MTELISAYAPTDGAGKTKVVFVHGLDGHVRHTWMSNRAKDDTLWPRWVGEAIGCPVWLLGYASAKTRWFGDAMSLPHLGIALLDTLCSAPAFADDDAPIVLVGHSLGGLVIKMAVKSAFALGVERYEKLARRIKGIVFVGTPHFGSIWASVVSFFHLARPNPQMRNLGLHDEHLASLNTEFRNLVRREKILTRTFVETEPMRVPYVGRFLPGVTIVNPTSSEPNLPGEVGVPVQAHHLSICKPKDKNAHIHKSLLSFLEQVTAKHLSSVEAQRERQMPSTAMEAIWPKERTDTETHLAFAMFGDAPDVEVPIATTVCIVTDAPDRLRQELLALSKRVQADPLVDAKAKQRAQNASLEALLSDAGTRDAALRGIATISFSAYLYYCKGAALKEMSEQDRAFKFLVSPLVHRLSKRGEKVTQFHCDLLDFGVYLESAVAVVASNFHRTINPPERGRNKYHVLGELAQLVARASGEYLGDINNSEHANVFQYLRTRIRYAENVVTGERHTRDKNPLP